MTTGDSASPRAADSPPPFTGVMGVWKYTTFCVRTDGCETLESALRR